jgi:hypothetical protein
VNLSSPNLGSNQLLTPNGVTTTPELSFCLHGQVLYQLLPVDSCVEIQKAQADAQVQQPTITPRDITELGICGEQLIFHQIKERMNLR